MTHLILLLLLTPASAKDPYFKCRTIYYLAETCPVPKKCKKDCGKIKVGK